VGAGTRGSGRAATCSLARPAPAGTATSRRRADELARPLARGGRARERGSHRPLARRADRGRAGCGAAAPCAPACTCRPSWDPLREYRAQSQRAVARHAVRRPWPVADDRARCDAGWTVQPHSRGAVRIPPGSERGARVDPGSDATHLGRGRPVASRADRGGMAESPAWFQARPPPVRARTDVGSARGAGFPLARLPGRRALRPFR
jgi:hypothetical protein